MPIISPETLVYLSRARITNPVIFVEEVLTNASGVARLYLTDDGTQTGNNIFRNGFQWSTDVEAVTPTTTRTMNSGLNYVECSVTTLTFTGIRILGIDVLGSVANTPVAGVPVKFLVIGS